MQLTIKYFGLIAEITNCNEETVLFEDATVFELLELLYAKYPTLQEKDFKVAENFEIVPNNHKITKPEIALLPPFSGG